MTFILLPWLKLFNGCKIQRRLMRLKTLNHGRRSALLTSIQNQLAGFQTLVAWLPRKFPVNLSIFKPASDVPTTFHGSTIQRWEKLKKLLEEKFLIKFFISGRWIFLIAKENLKNYLHWSLVSHFIFSFSFINFCC